MRCSACGRENPTGSNFCLECGGPMPSACSNCGSELPSGSRFCNICGTPVNSATQTPVTPGTGQRPADSDARAPQAPVAAPEAERRQLTVMFCDLQCSTALSQRLDPEVLRDVIRSYQEVSAGAVTRFEGHIAKYLGDPRAAHLLRLSPSPRRRPPACRSGRAGYLGGHGWA